MLNDVRQTPDQFLTYIRNNINDFVNTSIGRFDPYNAHGVNDTQDLIDGKPGAMWSIVMLDNGTVILNNATPTSWSVSTIRSPIDGMHPVSGIREWGYTQNEDMSYVFYVSGVDRITDAIVDVASRNYDDVVFKKADDQWQSFQVKTALYINNNSGQATVGAQTKNRPNWASVRDYLNGKISLNTLKRRNGCI